MPTFDKNLNLMHIFKNIRNGNTSSEELVIQIIETIRENDPSINAIVCTPDGILKEARMADQKRRSGNWLGPLHGIPISIKDSYDLQGYPTTSGTTGLRHKKANSDALVVQRLRQAGAIVIAKTNTPELCLAYETDNNLFGRTNNPHDPQFTSGGSSGGEATLIASGGSLLGIGSDSGGSVRIPAHFCGVAGLKPTSGRLPISGHTPDYKGIWQQFSQPGPLARRVADLWLSFKIMDSEDIHKLSEDELSLPDVEQDETLRSLRIAFFCDNGVIPTDIETKQALQHIVDSLSDNGFIVQEKRPDAIPHTQEVFLKLTQADGGIGIKKSLALVGTPLQDCHTFTRLLIESAEDSPYAGYPREQLKADIKTYQQDMLTFMQDVDIILSPVFPTPAIKHGRSFDADVRPGFSYVSAYNLAGFPAVVVPVARSESGLPIGLQVAAAPFNDELALKFAARIEQLAGYWD